MLPPMSNVVYENCANKSHFRESDAVFATGAKRCLLHLSYFTSRYWEFHHPAHKLILGRAAFVFCSGLRAEPKGSTESGIACIFSLQRAALGRGCVSVMIPPFPGIGGWANERIQTISCHTHSGPLLSTKWKSEQCFFPFSTTSLAHPQLPASRGCMCRVPDRDWSANKLIQGIEWRLYCFVCLSITEGTV